MTEKPDSGMPDWDPSKEIDEDQVRKEYLEVMQEMVADYRANKKAEKERAAAGPPPSSRRTLAPYTPPTFAEISARMKKAWEEVKKIAPDAPAFVQAELLRTLSHYVESAASEAETGDTQAV